jgi:NTE family protein
MPDVLVLAGGGVIGEAWMTGVLAGIEDAAGIDMRRVESFVGTSAGSIVAAALAAGRSPRRPRDGGADDAGAPAAPPAADDASAQADAPEADDASAQGAGWRVARNAARWGWAATAPLAPAAIALGAPGGALARSALLARAPSSGRRLDGLRAEVERSGARFDGRQRICGVDKASGKRVVFGAPGAPPATVADAVTASCSIPWAFAPVEIGGREYVDGGVWSVTNLDVAPAGRDTQVLCLDPTASLGPGAGTLGALRQAFRVAAAIEVQALRGRGARVRHISPDPDAARWMGQDFMATEPAQEVLAAGYRQGRALARRAG